MYNVTRFCMMVSITVSIIILIQIQGSAGDTQSVYASQAIAYEPVDIIVLEHYHPDAEYVRIRVVDGDTVKLLDREESLRLVGYDAYELREPLGRDAKAYLQSLCSDGHAYMLVDALEPRDRFGRLLGYLWCSVKVDGYTPWIPVQRAFLASDLIKGELYIEPDLYPYWVWRESREIRLDLSSGMIGRITVVGSDGIRVYENVTGIRVPAGVYRVCTAHGDDRCLLVNMLDAGVYTVDIGELIGGEGTVHLSSIEGRRMAFIRAEIPSKQIGSIGITHPGDGIMARVKVVTDDGGMMTYTLRDGRDNVQIDDRVILIKIYILKKGSSEVCIEGLSGMRIMLNGIPVERPCIRFTHP